MANQGVEERTARVDMITTGVEIADQMTELEHGTPQPFDGPLAHHRRGLRAAVKPS